MRKNTFRTLQAISRLGIMKYLNIQLQLRMQGKYAIFEHNGLKITLRKNSSDYEVFRQVFVNHQYKLSDYLDKKPTVIVDLGCNNGLSMAAFKNKYPDCTIIGVEPDTDNVEMSKINTAAFSNVFIEQKAVWNEITTIDLFDPGTGSYSMNIVQEGKKVGAVETITMDEIFAKYKLDHIDILKVDVEGAEVELFKKGYTDWLKKVTVLVVETHDRKRMGCTEALFKAIAPYSFSVSGQSESIVIRFYHDK